MSDYLFTDINIDNNLIHNFYVIGLDSSLVLSDVFYQNISTMNDLIKPKVLSKFPPLSNTLLNLNDDILLWQCFPNGFFLTKADSSPATEDFFFELNNYPLHGKYPKAYYTAFLFYESVEYYYQIKLKKEIMEKNVKDIEAKVPQLQLDSSIDVSQDMKPRSISSDLICENATYVNYYLPKVIAFASVLPYPRELTKILRALHEVYSQSKKDIAIPIEKIIENFVLEMPVPPRGNYFIQYKLFKEKYNFDQSPINKIPNNSIELSLLFKKFKVPEVMSIYKCLLLEIPLLFFSVNKHQLTHILEGIVSLLYPFKYQRTKIAILPSSHISLIEMSQCFALGINKEYQQHFFIDNNLEVENKTIVIVDIDKIKITQLKADLKEHPNVLLEDVSSIDQVEYVQALYDSTDIPLHYKKKLMARLVTYLNSLKEHSNRQEDKETFNAVIREEFAYFLLSIFSDLSRYIKLDSADLSLLDKGLSDTKSTIDINSIFKVKDFLLNVTGDNLPFFKRFCDTEIFKDYIIRRIYPRTSEEKLEVMFFDEKIIEKRNKNLFSKTAKTPLLELKEIANSNLIQIQKPKGFTAEEVALLSKKGKAYQALGYFQMLSCVEDNLVIKYPVFPLLLYDNEFIGKPYYEVYLYNNIPIPVNLRKELNKTFDFIVSQPHYNEIYQGTKYNLDLFSQSKSSSIPMEDYINLTWLMLFALSFWYNEKQEKAPRFAEMLEVFDKLDNYDEEVLSLLYFSILTYGDDAQAIKLYEKIIKCIKLNNYEMFSFLCIKLSRSFNAKTTRRLNSVSSRTTLLMREAEETASPSQEPLPFTKRYFSSGMEGHEANEAINFDPEVKCEHCSETTELHFLSLLEKRSDSTDAVWRCSKCDRRIRPKIKAQINQEKVTSFEVFTPFDLFLACRCKLMTNNQFKFDVESFRKKNSTVFFNSLLYFSMRNLSFDFLIPYQMKSQVKDEEELIDEGNAFVNLEITSKSTEVSIESNDVSKAKPMQSKFILRQRVKSKGSNSLDFDSLRLNQINLNSKEEPHFTRQKSERKLTLDFKL